MGRLLLAVVSFLFLISSAYADHSGTYSSPAAAWAACNVLGDCSQQAASGTVSLSGGGSCALAGRYRYPYDHYFYYCDGAGISCPSGSTWSDTVQTCEVPPPPPCDSGITKTFSGVAIQNSDVPSSVCNLGCSYAGPGGPTTLFTLADGSFKWTSQYISDGLNCSSSTAGVSDVSSVFASAVPIPKIVSTATDGTQVASYTPTAGSAGDQLPFLALLLVHMFVVKIRPRRLFVLVRIADLLSLRLRLLITQFRPVQKLTQMALLKLR